MEHPQFDRLVRAFGQGYSRRTVTMLVGAALALPLTGRNSTVAKRKKKKKVTLCLDGETITVPKKKTGGFLKQGATPGACPPGGGSGCPCDPCLREICVGSRCECPGGMARDSKGVCGVVRGCTAVGQTAASPALCCSGQGNPISSSLVYCIPGNTTCASDSDCLNSQHCVGNLCASAYVAAVGEQCAERAFDICSNRNQCSTALCTGNLCRECSSDAQCGDDRAGDDATCRCIGGRCVSANFGVALIKQSCSECPLETAFCEDVTISFLCWPRCGRRLI